MKQPGEKDLIDRCISILLKRDELLKRFHLMKGEERDRELNFTRNSLLGFIDYLKPFLTEFFLSLKRWRIRNEDL